MPPWSDIVASANAVIVSSVGEPITPCTAAGVASGDALTGVLYRRGDALADQWPGQSVGFQYQDQPQPFVSLHESDAAGIAQNSHLLSDDGVIYRVTRIYPADDGLVRLDLTEDNH